MNVITDTLRQLVRRKLWPVALLLIGAAAAVPTFLGKDPEPAPATAAAKANKTDAIPATFVSAQDAEGVTERRRVLGAAKDPFEPAALPKVKKKKAKAASAATATPTAAPDTGAAAPTTTGGGGGAVTAPPVSPAPAPAPTHTVPAFSIKVRFGAADADEPAQAQTVERLSVLPDDENPVLVYRGVEDGGKAAIFELTGKVDAQGDGTCLPTPEDCQYLKLRAGETEFITISDIGADTDAQFQLDLVKIYKKATKEKASDDAQMQSLAKASRASLMSKTVQLRRRNRYVFNRRTGTLRRFHGGKAPRSAL